MQGKHVAIEKATNTVPEKIFVHRGSSPPPFDIFNQSDFEQFNVLVPASESFGT